MTSGRVRSPGSATTCGICGEVIAVPATPLIMEGVEVGSIIDLDAQWEADLEHHKEKHPDHPMPPRLL